MKKFDRDEAIAMLRDGSMLDWSSIVGFYVYNGKPTPPDVADRLAHWAQLCAPYADRMLLDAQSDPVRLHVLSRNPLRTIADIADGLQAAGLANISSVRCEDYCHVRFQAKDGTVILISEK